MMKPRISIFTAIILAVGVALAAYVAAAGVKSIQYEDKIDAAEEARALASAEKAKLQSENETLRKLLTIYGAEEPSAPEESGDISAETSENGTVSTPEESGEIALTERQEALLSAMNILKEARYYVETLYVFKGDSEFAIDADEIEKAITEAEKEILTDTSIPVEEIKDYLLYSYFNAIKDPFTLYHTVADMEELTDQSAGRLYGIGVYIYFDSETSSLYIERVMPDSPAEKAGLKIGDRIKSIEGVDVSVETYDSCIASVAGELGTEVDLVVIRDGETLNIRPLRGEVRTRAVYTDYFGDYAVINIKEFSGHVAEDFREAVNEAESKGVKGYVFDVRDNPGGDLGIICDVLDVLLPQGHIVTIVQYDGKTYSYDSDANCVNKPMVVLCDDGTASAGELFTCALKDYHKATIIGKTTYGKGTMQQIYYLSDRSGFRVSMAYYNPPSGENYHLKGVTPDIDVDQSAEVTAHPYLHYTKDDLQFNAAIDELNRLTNN